MQLTTKRKMRKLPFIGAWHMFRVLYSQDELERLEAEMKIMQAEYDRLTSESEDVLEETRRANPRVSSELHILELVRYKARQLKAELDYQKMIVEEARNHVE
ncbi:hypothetical protein [Mixta mediterraneensis]|uniref:hypothetical protein n=1 Tax=Mixta mediterraneensis TaxID=2758443 RepID=UPI00187533F5|nr:hypothetical protein [Mixta mediterraneensis]MBE5254701.1 hypothetical protein [Mixta mediterraneensis]